MKQRSEQIINAVEDWNKNLSQSNKQLKYKKMLRSPYAFFRGTNHLFWADFSNDNRLGYFYSTDTLTWIIGDLHAYNFGISENAEGQAIYNVNDFDESFIGDYQYDVWRMAISIALIAAENNIKRKDVDRDAIEAFCTAYLDTHKNIKSGKSETTGTFDEYSTYGKLDNYIKKVRKKRSQKDLLKEWTTCEKKNNRLLRNEKLENISESKRTEIVTRFAKYVRQKITEYGFSNNYFTIKDIAQRINSGTGSLGIPRYYILIEGAKKDLNEDRILDVKLQVKPTACYFMDNKQKILYNRLFPSEGQRFVDAFSSIIYKPDKHSGWFKLPDGEYSVCERSKYKTYFPVESIETRKEFCKLSEQWGIILATAHATSYYGFSKDSFYQNVEKKEIMFNALVREIAIEYARQVAEDWKSFASYLK